MQFEKDQNLHQAAHALAMEYVRTQTGKMSSLEDYADYYQQAYATILRHLREQPTANE